MSLKKGIAFGAGFAVGFVLFKLLMTVLTIGFFIGTCAYLVKVAEENHDTANQHNVTTYQVKAETSVPSKTQFTVKTSCFLRKEPSISSEKIGTLTPTQKVRIIKIDRQWKYVETATGVRAWCGCRLLPLSPSSHEDDNDNTGTAI